MIDYPYDFRNGYKVQTVYANKTAENSYGDIYDFRADVEREHPGSEIMIGYCVIFDSTGLIPEGCNDWNDTISDAIRDYEEHIVPVLEREKYIELNRTELDSNGNSILKILFSVKSGWLQDYFGVDNHCQLEALLTNSDEWDPEEIFKNAHKNPDLSGLLIGESTEFEHISKPNAVLSLGKSIFLEWSKIDIALDKWAKNYFGDHVSAQGSRDEADFEVELFSLRPSDYVKYEKLFDAYDTDHDYDPDTEFETSPHSSVLPVVISRSVLHEALPGQALTTFGTSIATYDGVFLMEYVREQKEAIKENPSLQQGDIVKNLITAMAAYGLENNWCDSDIIDTLVGVGITQEDFLRAGFENFTRDYFADEMGKKNSLDAQIQSASDRTANYQSFSSEKRKRICSQEHF